MTWYKVHFTRAEMLDDSPVRLQKQFAGLHAACRGPEDAALFCRSIGPDAEFFFSPAGAQIAGKLIEKFSGVECETPEPRDFVLLAGDRSAWNLVRIAANPSRQFRRP